MRSRLTILLVSALFLHGTARSAQLKAVQAGAVTLTTGATAVTALFGAVDTGKSFVLFSCSPDSADPENGQISGQILDATHAVFQRFAAGGASDIRIQWQVAEFLSGVTVLRGMEAMTSSP